MENRILIIDDDSRVGESLKKVLLGTGYMVVLALDGQDGLEKLAQQPFDVLILDLDLPRISGWDILDVATERYPALPVIILTALADQCDSNAFAGAHAVLVKPPEVCLLLKTIENLLSTPVEKRSRRVCDPLKNRPSFPVGRSTIMSVW